MRRLLPLVCAVSMLAALPSAASANHAGDVNCSAFATQAAAQSHLVAHPGDPDGLDGDDDGRACQGLPCPCGATGTIPAPTPPTPAVPVPAPPAVPLPARSSDARVVRVIDGDTLKVRLATGTQATVRLIGIDTPETRKPGTPIECGGVDATARMRKLALRRGRGVSVLLRTDPTQARRDRFGRLLAYVSRAGVDFGRSMVLSGWAASYVYEVDYQRVGAYRSAQSSAKAAPRGVWRTCGGDFHRPR